MKNILKKIAVFVLIVGAISASLSYISSGPTFAEGEKRSDGKSSCNSSFFGLTMWDCGFQEMEGDDAQDILIQNIALIASNILTDITVIAAYLIIGYVMYGGYLYMFSAGDPAKVAAGKKTLTNAFIGLAIVLSAYTIFGAIRIALIGGTSLADCSVNKASQCVKPGKMVTNLIQWVAGVAGVVSVAFVVIGGWGYITSAGDPAKLQKAKNTIFYALIGLIIVAMAEIITAFVSSTIKDANEDTGYLEPTSIVANINNKETLYEKT